MPAAVENPRLRELYQTLPPPATAAMAASDATMERPRMNVPRMTASSCAGDNGPLTVSPFWVRVQEVLADSACRAVGAIRHTDRRVGSYLCGLSVLAASVAAWLLASDYPGGPIWVLIVLGLVGATAEHSSVRLNSTLEISISLLPTLFAAVAFGPLAAMMVSAATMLGDFRRPYLKWAVHTLTRSVNGAITGTVALHASALSSDTFASIAWATAAAAVATQSVDTLFAGLTAKVRRTGNSIQVMAVLGRLQLASAPLYAAVVVLLTFSYRELSPWTVLLFLVPTLTAQRLFVLYQDQRRLSEDLLRANDHLERANLSFATALVTTLDARDHYTAGHSAAVAVYARDIAARLRLPDEQQQLAHVAGLLHDIGKVGLPATILQKNGPLTASERRQMEEHVLLGERILRNVEDYSEIATIVRHHHERVDGSGYPDGLCGDEIPLVARIIAVADAYNAMTSQRPYRDAMRTDVAQMQLADAAATQFDATVVAALRAILADAGETYSSGARPDFAVEAQRYRRSAPAATAA